MLNIPICDRWENFLPKIKSESVDLVLTDPPYGVNYLSHYRTEKHLRVANDKNLDGLPALCAQLHRVLKTTCHGYMFCSWHNLNVFTSELGKFFRVKNVLVWKKHKGGMGDLKAGYSPNYELIIYFSKGSAKPLNGKRELDVLEFAKAEPNWHPTPKPLPLLQYLIEKSTEKGDTVLDCFAGSFSTAEACANTGRNFYACELEKIYLQKYLLQ